MSQAQRKSSRAARRPRRTGGRLGAYTTTGGRPREVVARAGSKGSLLVIDRDIETGGDELLVAHLGADEPLENASLVCGCYLAGPARARIRAVTEEDRRQVPFGRAEPPTERPQTEEAGTGDFQLRLLQTGMSIPELRWCRAGEERPLSLREVIGALQCYEPARHRTAAVVAAHRGDEQISIVTLAAELARVQRSAIVLNRGLREAVVERVATGSLSLSEIAVRCGRVKRDSAGNLSGETSWLSRRLGLLAEGGGAGPTPWVHSDVLALISRQGLGIAPREVELG